MLPPMFSLGRPFYIAHVGRVPMYADFGVLILLWIGSTFGGKDLMTQVLAAVVLLISVILHELAHAVVAMKNKLFGVTIVISTMGGYCTYAGDVPPIRKVGISLAGPITNGLLALIAWAYFSFIITEHTPDYVVLAAFLTYKLNLILGILNIMPIYPLDGGQAVYGLLRHFRVRNASGVAFALSVFSAVSVLWVLYSSTGQLDGLLVMLIAFLLFQAWGSLK